MENLKEIWQKSTPAQRDVFFRFLKNDTVYNIIRSEHEAKQTRQPERSNTYLIAGIIFYALGCIVGIGLITYELIFS